MSSDAFALQVQVESPTITDGLRADHPRLAHYIQNGIKMGWNNEHIIKVIGAPAELVSRERSKLEKQKLKK